MEVTELKLRRGHGVRQWLRADAPASRAALVFLFVSALLCGSALSGLLFVGVWRHTAGEASRTRVAQLGEHRALLASRRTLAQLRTRLAQEQALLATTKRRAETTSLALGRAGLDLRRTRAELLHAQTTETALTRSLAHRLGALQGTAAELVKETATIQSELAALESYAQHPGAAGIDSRYLQTQAHYLAAAAASAVAAADDVAQHIQEAQAASTTAVG
jgi:hypothetical protein